jgi:hydrogenase nickel incorporation protein HypB
MDIQRLDVLIIENVGNLVCTASYDLGEDFRVVLFSVTEGEDKPLKYPTIFRNADLVLITKLDLAEAAGAKLEEMRANVRLAAPRAEILELSARGGNGMQGWYEWLLNARQRRTGLQA